MGNYPLDGEYVGTVLATDRLSIPALLYNDGPQGFRDDANPGTTTALPSGLNVAASWSSATASLWGDVLGSEFFAKGANVMLGPGLNVARVPTNGRNFEYMSGEDPFLGASLVPAVIASSQAHKILANAKHFTNNNQETNRGSVSSNVDERTRFEMYYPPFQAAIDAGVGSFMCSYNKINHVYSCENPETLQRDLKGVMGFQGFVMSDWGATHSASLLEGLDQEMADSDFMNVDNLKDKPVDAIDASVRRILKPFIDVGAFDLTDEEIAQRSIYNNVTSADHFDKARTIAADSHVLVQNNNGVLPLAPGFFADPDVNIGVFGSQAGDDSTIGGGGSGRVDPSWKPTPLNTIHARAAGKPYGATSDKVKFVDDEVSLEDQIALAQSSDVCLFFLQTSSSEGADRDNLNLVNDGNVAEVATHCAKSVAVVTSPGAVLMPWSNSVDSIILNFMPGVASAFSTMDILLGDVNPSGHLPITMPAVENQEGFTTEQFPGLDDSQNVTYTEHYAFGYRYYHLHNESPRFWFGHGLSYTEFSVTQMAWGEDAVKISVKNVGVVGGAAVPQMYLNAPVDCNLPVWQLKGFEKIFIEAGEEATLEFPIADRDLSTWNVANRDWEVCKGDWMARVGFSAETVDDETLLEKTI
jgi:beta-glucosidase